MPTRGAGSRRIRAGSIFELAGERTLGFACRGHMVTVYILGLLVAAVVLFSMERLSVDMITLLLLLALLLPGILTPSEAFAGFSSDIIIILASIFVLSAALQGAGVLDWIGEQMRRHAKVGSPRFLFTLMGAVGATSSMMNNTTVTALFTPVVTGLARKGGVSPSKLLMPVAFASIMGGTCTLIGTSTNVAVSGFMQHQGLEPVGMFETTFLGVLILLVGIAYMMLIGVRMLPVRHAADVREGYALRQYLSEIVVREGSPLDGQSLGESDLAILDFNVLKVVRAGESLLPDVHLTIRAGDRLIVSGHIGDLMKVREIEGIDISADRHIVQTDLAPSEWHVSEVLVEARSQAVGRTLVELNLHRRTGALALAMYRHGHTLVESLENTRLREGDVLLVQANPGQISVLRDSLGLMPLDTPVPQPVNKRRGVAVLGVFLAAVILGSLGILPLSVCFLAAAVAAVLLKAVSIERAYHFIDWRLLILIGGMTAFGVAMEKTGTAELLAGAIVSALGGLGPHGVLAGFFLLTIALTQPMSNAAAALVVLPVAIQSAEILGSNPRTFAIGVMLAASVSFIAPLEPSCVLVYGPGKYRFFDFVKVGLGLTIVLAILVLLLLPVFWPL